MNFDISNFQNRDDWKIHFRDTMRGGKMLNDWKMAEIHAKNAPKRRSFVTCQSAKCPPDNLYSEKFGTVC